MASPPETTYPVAIIGGGPTGLAASILLSLSGISHVLFERYASTSIHPKACSYNHRTVEIFRMMGVEDEPGARDRAAQPWGGGEYEAEYANVSPCQYTILPQIRLEPILQRRAVELNGELIFYETEVLGVEESDDSVVVTVQRKGKEQPETFHASFCISADGGRGLTDSLGIAWEGERDIIDMVSAHVRAPISQHHPDMRNFITWFINPKLGGSIDTCYLYHLGPYPIAPNTEEWLFACALDPADPKRFDEGAMLKRMHDTLQIPDLQVELLSTSHWYVNALCATRYRSKERSGRVFLVGDAAHRIPPWGALGLNTGIQDVHNLVWKLSLAIKGLGQPSGGLQGGDHAFDALLDTYDTERRPIGQRVRTTSLHNLRSHALVMDTALGLSPTQSKEENVRATDSFFDEADANQGKARREAVDRAQKILDVEFHALGAEIGWFYPDVDTEGEGAATRHDGQADEKAELDTLDYHPSTIPGHHLPHVWLAKRGQPGQRVSTRDLVRYDGFILITSTPRLWRPVVDALGSQVVHLVGIVSRDDEGEDVTDSEVASTDTSGAWPALGGVQTSGAVLVRPDGIVSWRAQEFVATEHGQEGWLKNLIYKIMKIHG